MLADTQNFDDCSIFNSTFFFGFKETSSNWSVQFVQFFSAFTGQHQFEKARMISVSFVNHTESYEVSLVTINWQTFYASGMLRQNYGTYKICR